MIAPIFETAFEARDQGLVHFGATPALIARRAFGPAWLASPITLRFGVEGDAAWFVLERLLREAALDCDALAAAGVSAISPAVLALEMIRARGLGWERSLHGPRGVLDRDCWMAWCRPILRACALVVVADRPGWAQSQGVASEVEFALSRNIPVFFMAEGVGDVSAINGASARAMAEWIVSRGGDRWYPADAGDFGRCESLLDHVPALRARLGEMAEANAYWAALVPEWPRLRMIADGAALSAAVRAIIKPIERLDPGCAVLPNASFRVGDVCFSAEEYLMAKAARGKQVPMKEDAGDKAVASAAYGVTADELRQFVERYERLAQEKAEIAGQQKEVMAEAKGRGYDTKVIKMIIALRKRAPDEVAEEQAVLDLYKSALGMD